MNENEMGYRGSKSEILKQNPQPYIRKSVKEQRVDGGYCNKLMQLRCTLMAFERKYQVKIPSKQLNINKFSTFSASHSSTYATTSPWFWTGLIDAEG